MDLVPVTSRIMPRRFAKSDGGGLLALDADLSSAGLGLCLETTLGQLSVR
jgi:hypothetical protein